MKDGAISTPSIRLRAHFMHRATVFQLRLFPNSCVCIIYARFSHPILHTKYFSEKESVFAHDTFSQDIVSSHLWGAHFLWTPCSLSRTAAGIPACITQRAMAERNCCLRWSWMGGVLCRVSGRVYVVTDSLCLPCISHVFLLLFSYHCVLLSMFCRAAIKQRVACFHSV